MKGNATDVCTARGAGSVEHASVCDEDTKAEASGQESGVLVRMEKGHSR